MDRSAGARHATGAMFAIVCLFLLGLMPIISNGRPPGSGALAFAFWLSVWQLASPFPFSSGNGVPVNGESFPPV
jgi:hypothetical protein